MLKAPSGAGWEFDTFSLMPNTRLLLRDGHPLPLMAKGFDTLVLLVENRDRVVSKHELLHAVWPDVVVEEGNLTQQIFLLRKALGDSAQQPRYIVTVPGYGYRFTATVREISLDAPPDEAAPAAKPVQAVSPSTRHPVMFVRVLGGILAALVVVLAFRRTTLPVDGNWLDAAPVRIQKITESGRATHAAMSRDGRYVAYVESDGGEYSVHVQHTVTGGNTVVVARQPQMLAYLRFSSDGEYVYFTRATNGPFVLSRVPTIGGHETPVLRDVDTPISFSPDGSRFVFMRGGDTGTQIVVADSDGGTERILEERKVPRMFSPVAPAWSPDGKWVAASAADESKGRQSSIVLLPVNGGRSRDLYAIDDRIGALRWLPDGSGLLAVQSTTRARAQFSPWLAPPIGLLGGSVWRISYPGGVAERLTPDLADYDLCCLDVTADGRSIAGVVNSLVSDLWIAPAERLDTPKQITHGSAIVARHSWLDADTIVYADVRGRVNAVRKDTSGFSLAVPDGHKVIGGVSACGDGRYVVFQTVPGNNIWRVAPTTGGFIKLTNGAFDLNPACSRDGQWMVYSSRIRGAPSGWRMSIDGGQPAPLVPGETFDSLPSPSGRLIYHNVFEGSRPGAQRWAVIPASGGNRVFSIDRPADMAIQTLPSWAPDESGLDYIVTRNGVSNVWRQPLTKAPPVQVTHLSAEKIFSLAWSPDGEWLSLASGSNRSDVVLISRER